MRILMKFLLFPIIMLLTIFVALCRLFCVISGTILTMAAFVILVIAICAVVLLQEPLMTGVKMAVLAWIICPFGIPLVATFLVELLGGINDMLKAI